MNDLLNERKQKLASFKELIKKRVHKNKPVIIPDGVFRQCEHCGSAIYAKDLEAHLNVCPHCGHHFKIDAFKRIEYTCDDGSFKPLFNHIASGNPLKMPDYEEKYKKSIKQTHMNEAILCGEATVGGYGVAFGVLDATFMMGSMGSAVGEKITRLIEHAATYEIPLIIFSASGGARMQEGILSLMQMAKTAGALNFLDQKRVLYISVMTHPTTGGVAASYASLGDINIAEKSSLIGFAGERVIKQTIGQALPEGFQTDFFQLQKGQVDMVIDRKNMRRTIIELLKLHDTKKGMRI